MYNFCLDFFVIAKSTDISRCLLKLNSRRKGGNKIFLNLCSNLFDFCTLYMRIQIMRR